MSQSSIRAVELTKKFRSGQGELVVFEGLTFEIPAGIRLALVGESGTGKSTLLHLLGGLDRPTRGTIHFGPNDIFSLSDTELADLRNREIGFVWQNQSLLPEFTALENVMMPLLIRGTLPTEASGRALRLLSEVGLQERTTHRAGELSGGEQQRVVLARALVGNPRVLLADEPTGSLDSRTGGMIMDLLAELHRAHDLTSVYVTHNLTFASRCDLILQLVEGTLVPLTSGSEEDAGGLPSFREPAAGRPIEKV